MNIDESEVPSGLSVSDWDVTERPLTSSAQASPIDSQDLDQPGSPIADETQEERINHPEMRMALKALMDKNITLVEWGTQLQYRCGYEEILIVSNTVPPAPPLGISKSNIYTEC